MSAPPRPTTPAAGTVEVDLQPGWGFLDKMHGGYLLATVVGAALEFTDPAHHPHPVAVQAVYAAAPVAGPATVAVQPLRAGRTFATLRASLCQNGQPTVEVLVTAGRLPAADDPVTWDGGREPMPVMPPPDRCVGGPDHAPSRDRLRSAASTSPARAHIVTRLDPASAPPPYGPGGQADFRGWVRCALGDPVLGALVLADALPPVVLDIGLTGVWVPTLQLQVLLRRVPPAGWLAGRQWGTLLAGGLLDESCTLWDPQGRVVAQARQLAAARSA